MSVGGTTPADTVNEEQAATWVRRMFEDVAPRYDLLNHLLSFNVDRSWRKRLMQAAGPVLRNPHSRILDLCCGTGDVLLDLQTESASPILGADFCHPMLVTAQRKISERQWKSPLFEADALRLPLKNESLDAITIAFGFRNLANYQTGLLELARVLKPGGMLLILEFSHPPGLLMKTSYGLYSRWIMPTLGAMISGSRGAYTYLPESIKQFPSAEVLREMMNAAGFTEARFELLTGGIAALHTGTKS